MTAIEAVETPGITSADAVPVGSVIIRGGLPSTASPAPLAPGRPRSRCFHHLLRSPPASHSLPSTTSTLETRYRMLFFTFPADSLAPSLVVRLRLNPPRPYVHTRTCPSPLLPAAPVTYVFNPHPRSSWFPTCAGT